MLNLHMLAFHFTLACFRLHVWFASTRDAFYCGMEDGYTSTPAQEVTRRLWIVLQRALGCSVVGYECVDFKIDARIPITEQLSTFAEYGLPDGPPATSWIMRCMIEMAELARDIYAELNPPARPPDPMLDACPLEFLPESTCGVSADADVADGMLLLE